MGGAIGEGNSDPNAKERKGKKVNKESKGKRESEIKTEEVPIVSPIERCLTIALVDHRWVKVNSATEQELLLFNNYLERMGKYEMVPIDYKKYFATIKGKYPDLIKKKFSIEELREMAKQMDEQELKNKTS